MNIKTIQDLFDTLEEMDFRDKHGDQFQKSLAYLAIKSLLTDRMSEQLPEDIFDKLPELRFLVKSTDEVLAEDKCLAEARRIIKNSIENRNNEQLHLGEIYNANERFVVSEENKNDPGIIVQRCIANNKRYQKNLLLNLIEKMTENQFQDFCTHISALQDFSYRYSGSWVAFAEPNDKENYKRLRYPMGGAIKRNYRYEAAHITAADELYLLNSAKIFLENQQDYDPNETLEVRPDGNAIMLLYGDIIHGIAGSGFTADEAFKDFMYTWFVFKILK